MDLTDLRPAILFIHVLAAFGFVLSHGVTEAVAVIGVVALVALIWLMRFRPF